MEWCILLQPHIVALAPRQGARSDDTVRILTAHSHLPISHDDIIERGNWEIIHDQKDTVPILYLSPDTPDIQSAMLFCLILF